MKNTTQLNKAMRDKTFKGGEFIITETPCENVFSPDDFNQEKIMMCDSVTEFVEREIIPHKKRFEEHDYKLTESILKKAGELGFLGVDLPQQYKGLDMDFVSTILVCDRISGGTGSFATAFGAHSGIGTLPIALYGTKAQKKKYLPKLAVGQWVGAYALTEPGAGSDANSGKTKAELTADGKHYLLNGQKMWISNSGFAQVFTVFAKIGDDKNLSAFIVDFDKNNPNGIRLGEEEKKLGIHSSSTRQVFFNNTKIPKENILSSRAEGFKIAMHILNIGRIVLAAACLDGQRRIITQAVKYANEREQFKTKIADFEAIKGKLATMATATYTGESAVYRLAKMIDDCIEKLKKKGLSPEEAELKGVREYAVECSLLKVCCSEDLQNCSDEGIQIYGGIGFSKNTPMEAAWRDARIPRIYEGTNEINRMHAIGMLLEKALKGKLDLLNAAKKVQEELRSTPSFEKPDFSSLFSQEKQLLKKLKKAFLMVIGSAVKTYGKTLENHQHILMNTADILIQLFRAESVLLRTEKLVQQKGKEKVKTQIAISKLSLYQATTSIYQNAKEAIISFASGDEQAMLLMGLKRFTKYHNYPNIAELKNEIAERLTKENAYHF